MFPSGEPVLEAMQQSPPAKRRRVARQSDETYDDAPPQNIPAAPFWFSDGDLVLAVEHAQFRIHRSALHCSVIFADMLEIPQPQVVESVDGCPLVELAGDTANDWLVALKWIYLPEDFALQPVTFDTMAGALRLSTKYEIDELKRWAIRELQNHWPQNLSLMGVNSLPHAAEAISLARECSLPQILPAAFYALSIQRWTHNAEGGRSHITLSPIDLRRLIAGREALQDFLIRIIADPLQEDSSLAICSSCAPVIARHWRRRLTSDAAGPHGCWLLRELVAIERDGLWGVGAVCGACEQRHRDLAWMRWRALRDAIPRFFML